MPTDNQQIPDRTAAVDGTPFDFRAPRRIGDTHIDYTFTSLQRDGDGLFAVRLEHPHEAHHVALWMDRSYDYVEIFTGDTLPDRDRRRRGLGVEPMTAPPNALATRTDLRVLEPDEEWTGRWGVTSSGAGADLGVGGAVE